MTGGAKIVDFCFDAILTEQQSRLGGRLAKLRKQSAEIGQAKRRGLRQQHARVHAARYKLATAECDACGVRAKGHTSGESCQLAENAAAVAEQRLAIATHQGGQAGSLVRRLLRTSVNPEQLDNVYFAVGPVGRPPPHRDAARR